jgi:hypothetical protein
LNGDFYSDTVFSKVISLRQNKCAQVFAGEGYAWVHPMISKSEAGTALKAFAEDVGVPNRLTVDGASEQVGPKSAFYKQALFLQTKLMQTEPYTQRQNFAENTIGRLKRKFKQRMTKLNVPKRLWDYGYVWEAEILSRTASGPDLRTGVERITGDTPDISEWLDFSFYDLVWVWDQPGELNNPQLGRFLGIAHRIGSDLCYYVLKSNGRVLARTTVQHVTKEDLQVTDTKHKLELFNSEMNQRLADDNHIDNGGDGDFQQRDIWEFGYDDPGQDEHEAVHDHAVEADHYTPPALSNLINTELTVDVGGNQLKGKVKKRKRDNEGNPVGKWNANPILNTCEYEVEMSDGSVQEYSAM